VSQSHIQKVGELQAMKMILTGNQFMDANEVAQGLISCVIRFSVPGDEFFSVWSKHLFGIWIQLTQHVQVLCSGCWIQPIITSWKNFDGQVNITAIKPVVLFAREHAKVADEMGLEEGYQERTILFYTTYALEDQKEGMQTFIEKLEPDFENTQWLVVVKIYDNSWTACARFIL